MIDKAKHILRPWFLDAIENILNRSFEMTDVYE